MKKYLLLTATVFIVTLAKAQHFEWVASLGTDSKVLSSAVDAQGNLVIVAEQGNDGWPALTIVKMDKDGRESWNQYLRGYNNSFLPEAAFAACHKNGDISVFCNSEDGVYVDDDDFWGLLMRDDFVRNPLPPGKKRINYDEGYDDGGGYEEYVEEEEIEDDEDGVGYSEARKDKMMEKWRGLLEFVFTAEGQLKRILCIHPDNDIEIKGATPAADGGTVLMAFQSAPSVFIGPHTVGNAPGGAILVLKTDSMGTVKWVNPTRFLKPTCCTIYPSKMAVSPNGNIYITTMTEKGAQYPDGKKELFKGTDTGKYAWSDESFIVAMDANGKILWHKASGTNAMTDAITATNNDVFISGRVIYSNKAYGMVADTTDGDIAFIVRLDAGTGKPAWLKTAPVDFYAALTTDNAGNVYGVGEFKNTYVKPAWFYTDTLLYRLSSMVIASFDNKGDFRWVKPVNFLLEDFDQYAGLLHDECNNLFLTGSTFGGAALSGQYIDGAYLSQGDWHSTYAFKLKNNLNLLTETSTTNSILARQQIPATAIKGQSPCAISPAPWKVFQSPEFFSGVATIIVSTTYADEAVSLEIYNTETGTLAATLLSNKQLAKGNYEFPLNAAELGLKPGRYQIVLRGSATLVSQRLVYR